MRIRRALPLFLLLITCAVCAACGSREDAAVERGTAPPANVRPAAVAPAQTVTTPAAGPRIVVLGDSVTAGLGVGIDESFPALLQQRLTAKGLDFHIVNAGVSGDTSAGGVSRLDDALQGDVRVIIVALGGNDGLRGLPPEELQRNLSEIIERAQNRHVTVILTGMEAPPNFGADYTRAFHQVYPDLAKKYRVALVPFLLQGVAGDTSLNQPDGIHPNVRGAQIVADNIWAVLQPTIEKLPKRD